MKRWMAAAIFTLVLFASSARAQGTPIPGYTKLVSGITATTYVDTTCADAQQCFYYITAVDSLGESSPSAQVTATIPATSTVHTMTLTWVASLTPGVTYNVYKGAVPLAVAGVAVIPA